LSRVVPKKIAETIVSYYQNGERAG
jgi:hypothetical protein